MAALGKIRALALATVFIGSAGTAKAQNVDCRIALPRSGLNSVSAYINTKNDSFIVLRFSDPRFDDTTEVYKLRGCQKISSGVSSKSTYDETLSKAGFNRHSLSAGDKREFVNSIYGFIGLNVTQEAVFASLEINPPDLIDGISRLRDIIALKTDIDPKVVQMLSGHAVIDRIPAEELIAPPSNALSNSILAERYLNIEGAPDYFIRGNLKPYYDRYRSNIDAAAKAAIAANQGFGVELDKLYWRRVSDSGSRRVQESLAIWPKLRAINHDSKDAAVVLIDAIDRQGSFNNLQDLLFGLRGLASASDPAVSALVQRTALNLYRRHIIGNARNINAANAREGFVALHTAGLRSPDVEKTCMDALRDSGTFADAVNIYERTQLLGFVAMLQGLATTHADRLRLERIAVEKTVSPGRLFDAVVTSAEYSTSSEDAKSFWLANPFWNGYANIRGTVRVTRSPQAPIAMELGRYRVHVEISAVIPRQGTDGKDTAIVKETIPVTMEPEGREAASTFQLPGVVIASLRQTGWLSKDYRSISASEDGALRYRVVRVEPLP